MMDKRKLEGAVDQSLADKQIRECDAAVHIR